MSTSVPRALVVDDHPIVADATVTAIATMRIFDRVESAGSLYEACRMFEQNPVCNLVVLELQLRNVDRHGATLRGVRERFPEVPVLVFSADEALESVIMAFECGARGYVTKGTPMNVVTGAIRTVIDGGCYVPPGVAERLGFGSYAARPNAPPTLPVRLSGRQHQVFRLMLQGMPSKVIGARLAMAEDTVTAHLHSVYRALGASTRLEAILRARQLETA